MKKDKSYTAKKLGQVLLIDDNEDENEYNKEVIIQSGLADGVKSISHSEEALKHLGHCLYNGNNPDLIFLDVMMPRLNGYELLDKYRALITVENYPAGSIKIFILSCLPDDKEMDFYLNSPEYKHLVVGFRHKPLTVKMLREIKEEYFETSSLSGLSAHMIHSSGHKTERPRYKQALLSMDGFPSPLKD